MVLLSRQCFWHVWTSAISETACNHVRNLLERRLFRRLHFRHVQRFILNIYLRKSLCYMTRTSKIVQKISSKETDACSSLSGCNDVLYCLFPKNFKAAIHVLTFQQWLWLLCHLSIVFTRRCPRKHSLNNPTLPVNSLVVCVMLYTGSV